MPPLVKFPLPLSSLYNLTTYILLHMHCHYTNTYYKEQWELNITAMFLRNFRSDLFNYQYSTSAS